MGTLFEIASMQARWLAVRQAATAENVANASTPGFRAKEVAAFEAVLSRSSSTSGFVANMQTDPSNWSVRPSGNSVSLEEEMVKAGSISRSYGLNTGIVSAFHRMHMQAVRG